MWKEIFETKVIRVEGVDQTSLISCIYISDILSEELDPYNLDRPFELPVKTTCRLALKPQNSALTHSISFNTKIIEEDGVLWLPLKNSPENDLISSIPDEVLPPRVLILLQKKISLDVIKEGGEKSEIGSANEEDLMPEIKLCHSFGENFITPFDETFENNDQEITEVSNVRQLSYSIGLADEINKELQGSLNRTLMLLEIERKSKENVLREMDSMKYRFLLELQEAKKRENKLEEEVKEAESRYSAAKCETSRLKNETKATIAENARLLNTISSNEEFALSRIEELNKKIKVYEESFSDSDKILSKLVELSGGAIGPSNEVLKEKEKIIYTLQREVNDLKAQNSALQVSRQNNNIDELEETVQKYIRNFKLNSPFIRDREQTYVYGSKKLSILLKDGQLLCRVGGIFKPLDEYIGSFLSDLFVSHKSVKSSSDVQRELEEANKIKGTPTRKVNKSMTYGAKPKRS